jgi:two-component system, cell cycle sensor histidine kinase and response regulator CckA
METQGPAKANAPSDAKAPIRILIVDDEPPLLKMISLYLRRLGYAVTTCDRTEQASALIPGAIQEFAVAVLDATMAGIPMESLACDMLRAHPGLRVLAASGYPVDMRKLEAAAPGRVIFLHKPFTPEMLAATVRRMIAPEKEKGI